GIMRTFLVVIIIVDRGARRPGEQDRRSVGAGIMDDLRKPVDSVLIAVVEAVYEDEYAFAGRQVLAEPAVRLRGAGNRCDAYGCEFLGGVGRQLLRPLHFTHLAFAIRRNGYRDVGDLKLVAALAGEQDAGALRR